MKNSRGSVTVSAGKNLKPYQGLKPCNTESSLTCICCRKKPKTLSGIETRILSVAKHQSFIAAAGKNLKPYQGLKPNINTLTFVKNTPEKTYFPI